MTNYDHAGSSLQIKIEGCKCSKVYKSACNVSKVLKNDGYNLVNPKKLRGAITPLAPL